MDTTNAFLQELARLKENGNLRSLPEIAPDGKWIQTEKGKLLNLSSNDYLSEKGDNKGFVLMHSVGSLPHGSEIDTPINYADYYYLEALKRYLDLKK